MVDNYSWESLVQLIMTWGLTINLPWFVTGTGIGVPAGIAIGSSLTSDVQGFTLVSLMLYLRCWVLPVRPFHAVGLSTPQMPCRLSIQHVLSSSMEWYAV